MKKDKLITAALEIIAKELAQLDATLSGAGEEDNATPINMLSRAIGKVEGQQYRKTLQNTQKQLEAGDYEATLKYLACKLTTQKNLKHPSSLRLYAVLCECEGKPDEELVFVTGYRFVPDKRTKAVYYIGIIQQQPLYALLLSTQQQLEHGIALNVV